MSDFDSMRASLVASGYRDIKEKDGLRVGARVRHRGEQYYEAYATGTAVVRAIMERDPSSWSVSYGRRDIELIVERDVPMLPDMSPLGQWADYHTVLVVVEAPEEP